MSVIPPRIFLFCEGKTEIKYFDKIRVIFRHPNLKIIPINIERGGAFKNVRKLNSRIKQEINRKKIKGIKTQNIIYAIFDLDIFTIAEINTLQSGIDENVILIPSNWTFEYWILSHFKQYRTTNGKSNYINEIKTFFIPTNDKFTGDRDFNWLNKENIENAVHNVKTIKNTYTTEHLKSKDPYSDVDIVIDKIVELCPDN